MKNKEIGKKMVNSVCPLVSGSPRVFDLNFGNIFILQKKKKHIFSEGKIEEKRIAKNRNNIT